MSEQNDVKRTIGAANAAENAAVSFKRKPVVCDGQRAHVASVDAHPAELASFAESWPGALGIL